MSKRKYNPKRYDRFAKGNKFVRNKFAPDPLKQLNELGLPGKVANKAGNKVIDKPISKASYNITGLFYDKKKDSPYKGSIIYTLVKWFLLFILGLPIIVIIAKLF